MTRFEKFVYQNKGCSYIYGAIHLTIWYNNFKIGRIMVIKRYIEKMIRRYLEKNLTFYSRLELLPDAFQPFDGQELMSEYTVYGLMLDGKPIGVVHKDLN